MPTDTYTSLSAEDIVKVYTYQLVVNKVDGSNNKLAGVTFRLKRNSDNQYVTIDNNNKVTGWSNAQDNTTLLTTDANGQIKIIGLDDNGDTNEYTLIEVKPLPGYNTVADLPINIVPTFENQELKTLLPNDTAVADNIADGVANVKIVNKQGAQLPETGGIGTKIFYVLGGTLVIGSGAALVIKKRMGKDEE
jgi:LPXTG-motif cell wall-anchored protein